jgi:hypothetical protein
MTNVTRLVAACGADQTVTVVYWPAAAGVSVASFLIGILVGLRMPRGSGSGSSGSGGGARPAATRVPVGGKGAVELYVGNLPYDTADEDLQKLFAKFGNVTSARVITKKVDGQSKGFGFVEMTERAAAEAATKALNGKEFNGRTLAVNEARTRGRRRGRF